MTVWAHPCVQSPTEHGSLRESASGVALVFPGQGAQSAQMLDGVLAHPQFRERYELISDLLRIDVMREIGAGNLEILNQNAISSLMTVLVSTLSADLFGAGDVRPQAFAGYSVGQWAAMHVAGMLTFDRLVPVLVERARLMDECVGRQPGAMCAVIGIAGDQLNAVLEKLRGDGHQVFVSNYNCLGQYTIAGTLAAIAVAEERIAPMRPRKLVRLAVKGAWHCPILEEAERAFACFLETVELRPAAHPVIDNVTGDWLPQDSDRLRSQLARHMSHPVRWQEGISQLIQAGCNQFVEIGYGSNLTKFGFFIDRDVQWRTFYS